MEYNQLSAGNVTLSPRAWFIQNHLTQAYNTDVAVPAQIHNYMFIFTLERELVEHEILRGKSKNTIDQLIRILSKFDAALPDEEMAELLRSSQVALQTRRDDTDDPNAPQDELSQYMKMARTLKRTISTEIMKSGISNIVLADVLTSDARTLPLKDLGQFDFGVLSDAMRMVQGYYNMYTESVSTDELNTYASGVMWSNSALGFTRNLYRLMQRESGPSMTARLSYVIDTVFQRVFEQPYLDIKPVHEGLVYKVDSPSKHFWDMTFAECYGGYTLLKRTIEGYDSIDDAARLSMSDMIRSSVFNTAELPDYLPSELGPINFDKIKEFVVKRWLYHVIRRVSTSDFGTMVGRIESISDLRKYKRSDAVDNNLREANFVASILWDSFLDVGAELKEMVMNPQIHFPDVKPYDKQQFSKLFWEQMGVYNTFRFPIDSSRFIYEPAILINHKFETKPGQGIEWLMPDSGYSITGHQYDSEFRIHQFKKGMIKAGSIEWGKFKPNTDLRMLKLAEPFSPYYMMRINRPALLKMDAFKATSELISLKQLQETNMSKFLLHHADIQTFLSVEEIAVMQRIPMGLAKMIYDRYERMYARFTSTLPLFFIWEPEIAPIFEVSLPDDKRFKSFVTTWPYLLERTLSNGDPIYANSGGITLTVQGPEGQTEIDMKTNVKKVQADMDEPKGDGEDQKNLGFSNDAK